MSKMFPDPRRIVTGHNSEGKAVVVADSTVPCEPTNTGANFAVLYETFQFPASNDEWVDPIDVRTKDLANSQGVLLRVVDIPPGRTSQKMLFHRTESLDFGILHSGEVTCHLDGDERVDMKAGDVCVQRGTIHGWVNYSDKPARLYFVLSAANPVKSGDKLLKNEGYDKKDIESGGKQ